MHEHVQAVPSERNHTETSLSIHLEVSSLGGMTALTIILSKTPRNSAVCWRNSVLQVNDAMWREQKDWRPSNHSYVDR